MLAVAPATRARIVHQASLSGGADFWTVSLASGLLLGTLTGVIVAWIYEGRGPLLARSDDVHRLTGMTLLATLPEPPRGTSGPAVRERGVQDVMDAAVVELSTYQPGACLAVDQTDPSARTLADHLDAACRRSERARGSMPEPRRVIVIVTRHTRVNSLNKRVKDLRLVGVEVIGAIFMDRTRRRLAR